MGQIYVKVRDKSTDDNGVPTLTNGVETIITYKAFGYTQDKFELLFQCDENGRQIEGNPNLNAQHRQTARYQKSADHAVNVGPSQREKELLAEIERLKQQTQSVPIQEVKQEPVQDSSESKSDPVVQRRKPGPKPKHQLQEQVA